MAKVFWAIKIWVNQIFVSARDRWGRLDPADLPKQDQALRARGLQWSSYDRQWIGVFPSGEMAQEVGAILEKEFLVEKEADDPVSTWAREHGPHGGCRFESRDGKVAVLGFQPPADFMKVAQDALPVLIRAGALTSQEALSLVRLIRGTAAEEEIVEAVFRLAYNVNSGQCLRDPREWRAAKARLSGRTVVMEAPDVAGALIGKQGSVIKAVNQNLALVGLRVVIK